MNKNRPLITVLVPIKNEEWSLERFLSVTSQFADHILIADQGSTDRSTEICRRFPKVHLFPNPSPIYDESQRQHLLIDEARRVVQGQRLLLALDADEVLAADAPDTEGWKKMLNAAPGTIIHIFKPDLRSPVTNCLRISKPWVLGYMDDGAPHSGYTIHSTRVPSPPGHPVLVLDDVNVLHYNLVRPRALRAKFRRYCALEHLGKLSNWYRRTINYRKSMDWSLAGERGTSPESWFLGWERKGIDMRTIVDSEFYMHDVEVLRLFKKHGLSFFRFDDIWDLDWEKCRQWALAKGLSEIPTEVIPAPFWADNLVIRASQAACVAVEKLRRLVQK